jgi:hypothetical protein
MDDPEAIYNYTYIYFAFKYSYEKSHQNLRADIWSGQCTSYQPISVADLG